MDPLIFDQCVDEVAKLTKNTVESDLP